MKKHLVLILVMCFIAVSTYAQKPTLKEGFEGFTIGSGSSSNLSWSRNSYDITTQVVDNPNKTGINSSNKALKIDRVENNTITKPYEATYRGVTTTSYDFSNINSCVIEVKVLKNVAGKLSMRFYSDDANYREVISSELPASSEWQIAKFDFKGKITAPMTSTSKLLIQPEKNGNSLIAQNSALAVYIDDIKMVENNPLKVDNNNLKSETTKPVSEKAKVIDLNIWKVEDGNSGLVLNEMVKNPLKDPSINREKVMKVTKTGGPNAGSWHNVSTKDINVTMTKDNCVVEMKILFPKNENSVSISDMGLRMGDSYKGEVIQKVTAMDKWQTLQFNYSANSAFSSVFKLDKDSTITKISFLPRRDKEQESNVVVYIGDVKFLTK